MARVREDGSAWWEPSLACRYVAFNEPKIASIMNRANRIVPEVIREACCRAELPASTICALLVPLHTASAQGFLSFLWGGGSREVVSFHPAHAPGQIIISFGDKRLHLIHRLGETISYPIPYPEENSNIVSGCRSQVCCGA